MIFYCTIAPANWQEVKTDRHALSSVFIGVLTVSRQTQAEDLEAHLVRLVVGCGYLGLRVARHWLDAGDQVFAISRSQVNADRFVELGIVPIVADVTKPSSLSNLPNAASVLFAVGFDRATYSNVRDVYVDGFGNILNALPNPDLHLIYIGTTGVLADSNNEWLTEESEVAPIRPSSLASLDAEIMLASSHFGARATILRLAGIYGPNRIPRLASIRRREFKDLAHDGFINLIHVDDAAAVVCKVVEQHIYGETIHVSDGNPPLRTEFYQFISNQLGGGPIPWPSQDNKSLPVRKTNGKRLSNQKMKRLLDHSLRYPSYRSGIVDALGRFE